MKRVGFTLIELLVVIAIIAILAAILFPVGETVGHALAPTPLTGMSSMTLICATLKSFVAHPHAEWQWKANCYPNHSNHTLFRRPNRRVNYGFNETVFNDVRGYTRIATMKEPATLVVLADNWNTFLTPWARDMDGINVRIAYANGNPWDFGMCGCPANVTSRANETQKNNWPRHLGGAILVC